MTTTDPANTTSGAAVAAPVDRHVRPLLPKLDAAGRNHVVPGWTKRALCAAAADALRTRLSAGAMLANVAYNLAQRPGYVLTAEDCEMLRTLQREWDEV